MVEIMKSRSPTGVVYENRGGEVVRCALLKKSGQHVYSSVDDATDILVIHTVWGARRGRGPKL